MSGIVVMLVLTVMAGLLTGCASKTGNQSENAGDKVVTPTITSMFTPTNTPTATPTPIPHKTKQEVAEELKNVKVSVDDLMNEDVVYPTYFGAVDDNLTDEMIKRISYFESFGVISYSDANILVTYLNYCYLNSDAVDKNKAEQYLSSINETNSHTLNTFILTDILNYNYNHPDNQIVISWGAIDNALGKDGRAVLNNIQKETTKSLTTNYLSMDLIIKINTNDKYNICITNKDGSLTNIMGLYDDLNIAVKYFNLEIFINVSSVMAINELYNKIPSENTNNSLLDKETEINNAILSKNKYQ